MQSQVISWHSATISIKISWHSSKNGIVQGVKFYNYNVLKCLHFNMDIINLVPSCQSDKLLKDCHLGDDKEKKCQTFCKGLKEGKEWSHIKWVLI